MTLFSIGGYRKKKLLLNWACPFGGNFQLQVTTRNSRDPVDSSATQPRQVN